LIGQEESPCAKEASTHQKLKEVTHSVTACHQSRLNLSSGCTTPEVPATHSEQVSAAARERNQPA
jgi:hypothetical protein